MSNQAKKGDRIRISVEGIVTDTDYDGVYLGANGWYADDAGTFEILARADDPASDPVGTVRKNTGTLGGTYVRIDVISDDDLGPWLHTTKQFDTSHDNPTLGEIVGAVPGTPAAESQREPRVFNPGFGVEVPTDITLKSAHGYTFRYGTDTNPSTGTVISNSWHRYDNAGGWIGHNGRNIEFYLTQHGPLTEVL